MFLSRAFIRLWNECNLVFKFVWNSTTTQKQTEMCNGCVVERKMEMFHLFRWFEGGVACHMIPHETIQHKWTKIREKKTQQLQSFLACNVCIRYQQEKQILFMEIFRFDFLIMSAVWFFLLHRLISFVIRSMCVHHKCYLFIALEYLSSIHIVFRMFASHALW